MPKKIVSIISVGDQNNEVLKRTFQIEAVYYDTGHVEVSYLDKSSQTNSVDLEILGMEKSFHKSFTDSQFVEIVPFPNIPKYGWAIHPVVFNIDHQKFGKIQLKTEIHELGQPIPPVIYGVP